MIHLLSPVMTYGIDTEMLARDSSFKKVPALLSRYLSVVNQKSTRMQRQVNKRTGKTLRRLIKQERKMKDRLWKVDSTAADNLFSKSIDSLSRLQKGLKSKPVVKWHAGDSYLDTLDHSLHFLKGQNELLVASNTKLTDVTANVASLQGKLAQADQIKAYIQQHKEQLKQQLAPYTGFAKDIQKINKEAYYYSQQINEYKSLLKDKKKAEAKAMELLQKIPAYNDFIRKHSPLAALFNLGSSAVGTVAQSVEGLQTRQQVEQIIQQRIGSDPGARQAVSQQMDQARSQLNELKNRFPELGSAAEMPEFNPNPMKTKSFLQRLEFGGNIQFQKSSRYFPTTSDIAGQIGYMFHKNGSVGIGASYKLGLGSGWDHIAISHQGLGLRSFADWKVKGTIFVNGGFEQNYVSTITQFDQLKNWNGWQGSALLGISKKYKVTEKMKGNIVLLYDFLAKKNMPVTSPIKLRLGYVFN
ncbi:hypothetical protein [Chitinophaga sp. S165]|uniref:hypothetical protein n=1 Tax=Chitinophaga sp. S165 TaxID=2135462 RepID=UPI001E522700|nr:hypothetical protein [Chitinophaga sp. S165]